MIDLSGIVVNTGFSPPSISSDLIDVDQFSFFSGDSPLKKILFLDIGGVLNSLKWFKTRRRALLKSGTTDERGDLIRTHGDPLRASDIDDSRVAILNKIVKTNSCHIVISSAWRPDLTIKQLKLLLCARGFRYPDAIIGRTPKLTGFEYTQKCERSDTHSGMEVEMWLTAASCSSHKPPLVAIASSSSDFGRLRPFQVRTSEKRGGLTIPQAEKIYKIFNKQLTPGTELRKQRGIIASTINPRWKPEVAVQIAVRLRMSGYWDLAKLIAPHYCKYDRSQVRRGGDKGYSAASRMLSMLVIREINKDMA